MIYRASMVREFTQSGILAGAALLAIMVVTQVVRLLGQAAGGQLAPDAVLAMLGFGLLNYLSIVFSLTLFVAVLFTMSRAYRDSEMVVWLTSGISMFSFLRPVLYFAIPIAAVVGMLSIYLSPWAIRKGAEYQARIESRSDVTQITPGVFIESKRADRVFFVDSMSGDDKTISNLFVQSMQNGKLGVMVAERGHQEIARNGDKFLVLERGRRYEGTPGLADYKVVDFETYSMRIESKGSRASAKTAKALDLGDLLASPTPENMAELHWRIGLPVSVIVLAILAIPLGYVNPRASRSANLVLAILLYMVYSNMLSIAEAWVVQGKLSPVVGLWPIHIAVLAIALLLMLTRSESLTLHRWRRALTG